MKASNVSVECVACKKVFISIPSKKRKYCSLQCRDAGKFEIRNCVTCGNEFRARNRWIKAGKNTAQHCSMPCYLKTTGKKHDAIIDLWLSAYKEGLSIKEIGIKYSTSPFTITHTLRQRGITFKFKDPHKRFLSKIKINPITNCWEWQGNKNKQGYGFFTSNSKAVTAHRYAYRYYKGEITLRSVCHHCDNPTCCNPDHLFLGTQSDNVIDSIKKGRWRKPKVEVTN